MAGESAARALKRSIEVEEYNLRYGPVRFKTGASVGVSYTDNVFYSHNPKEDLLVNPEITLAALWPITDLNALRLSLGLAYEWYLKNRALNGERPMDLLDTDLGARQIEDILGRIEHGVVS